MREDKFTDGTVKYDDSTAARAACWDRLLTWFKETACFSGECIWQDDDCMERAPEILTELAEEVFKFDPTYE